MIPAVKCAGTHEHKETLHSYNKSWLLAPLGLIQEQQVICSPGSLSYCLPVLPVGPGFACRELAPVGNDSWASTRLSWGFPRREIWKEDVHGLGSSLPALDMEGTDPQLTPLSLQEIPWECTWVILHLWNTTLGIWTAAAKQALHKVHWEASASASGTCSNSCTSFLPLY